MNKSTVLLFIVTVITFFVVVLSSVSGYIAYAQMERKIDQRLDDLDLAFLRLACQHGYHINKEHPSDIVKTDSGYDVILHFVKGDQNETPKS